MDYEIQFKNGKTQTDEFRSDIYNYIENVITRFFKYDGNILTFFGNETDIHKIEHFVRKYNGETIIK